MATSSFDWTQALTGSRLRASGSPARGDEGNQFLSDYYRVAFSSAFRRLQDKTQVNPLADTDFVRRRLTHSVEVATVGERMGRVTATRLQDRLQDDHREAFGRIIATASLLHDIGKSSLPRQRSIRRYLSHRLRELAAKGDNAVDGQGLPLVVPATPLCLRDQYAVHEWLEACPCVVG